MGNVMKAKRRTFENNLSWYKYWRFRI